MKSNFYSKKELEKLGFKKIGKNSLISRKCSIYSNNIEIGNNVRIDDFSILSGKIKIGSYVHIAAGCYLYGKYGITIGNYCSLSARTIIYSAIDDFSGNHLVGPVIPEKYLSLIAGEVKIEDYVALGANTIVMPNLTIGVGSATGACSLVRKDLDEWSIYVGIPCKKLKDRDKGLLKYVEELNKTIE